MTECLYITLAESGQVSLCNRVSTWKTLHTHTLRHFTFSKQKQKNPAARFFAFFVNDNYLLLLSYHDSGARRRRLVIFIALYSCIVRTFFCRRRSCVALVRVCCCYLFTHFDFENVFVLLSFHSISFGMLYRATCAMGQTVIWSFTRIYCANCQPWNTCTHSNTVNNCQLKCFEKREKWIGARLCPPQPSSSPRILIVSQLRRSNVGHDTRCSTATDPTIHNSENIHFARALLKGKKCEFTSDMAAINQMRQCSFFRCRMAKAFPPFCIVFFFFTFFNLVEVLYLRLRLRH